MLGKLSSHGRLASTSGTLWIVLLASSGFGHAQGVPTGAVPLMSNPPAIEAEAANAGDVQAELTVGKAYYGESNVRRNYREAVKWFVAAAGQGSVEAEAWLGSCYLYPRHLWEAHDVPQYSFGQSINPSKCGRFYEGRIRSRSSSASRRSELRKKIIYLKIH